MKIDFIADRVPRIGLPLSTFSWAELVAEASQKEVVAAEDLAYRLDTFPIENLASVPLISPLSLAEYDALRITMRDDIAELADNSVAEKEAPSL